MNLLFFTKSHRRNRVRKGNHGNVGSRERHIRWFGKSTEEICDENAKFLMQVPFSKSLRVTQL